MVMTIYKSTKEENKGVDSGVWSSKMGGERLVA